MDVLDKLQKRYRKLDRSIVDSLVFDNVSLNQVDDRDLIEQAMTEIRMLRLDLQLHRSVAANTQMA